MRRLVVLAVILGAFGVLIASACDHTIQVQILASTPQDIGGNHCQVDLHAQTKNMSGADFEWWQVDTSGHGNDVKLSTHETYSLKVTRGQQVRIKLVASWVSWNDGVAIRDVDCSGIHNVADSTAGLVENSQPPGHITK